jgi:hypothetical protein
MTGKQSLYLKDITHFKKQHDNGFEFRTSRNDGTNKMYPPSNCWGCKSLKYSRNLEAGYNLYTKKKYNCKHPGAKYLDNRLSEVLTKPKWCPLHKEKKNKKNDEAKKMTERWSSKKVQSCTSNQQDELTKAMLRK